MTLEERAEYNKKVINTTKWVVGVCFALPYVIYKFYPSFQDTDPIEMALIGLAIIGIYLMASIARLGLKKTKRKVPNMR